MIAKIGRFRSETMLLLLSLWAAFSTVPEALAQNPTGTKWYPGHYVFLGQESVESMSEVISNYKVVRGIQKRYEWKQLEVKKGKYDFSEIIKDLNTLAARGQFLVVQVQHKNFSNAKVTPAYLESPLYEGGIYQMKKGWNVRLWNNEVYIRLIELYKALGSAIDNHPALALVNVAESAMGVPLYPESIPNFSTKSKEGTRKLATLGHQLRSAFSKTPTLQYFNFPPGALPDLEKTSLATGNGHGGPDTFPHAWDSDMAITEAYETSQRLAGKVPIGYAVQYPNYVYEGKQDVQNPTAVPIQDLYNFSKIVLRSNFMFWQKRDPYWKNVLKLWQQIEGKNNPSGGLSANCPLKIAPCRNATEVPLPEDRRPTGEVKWFPGHYVHVPDLNGIRAMNDEIASYPIVKGFQTRIYWDELETKKDTYNFSKILEALEFVKSKNKRLAIQIQFKTFNDQKKVPAYLLTSTYEGGVYKAATGGWNLRLWNENVQARFQALIRALGKATNSHQSLALVNLAESAAGPPAKTDPLSKNWTTLARLHAQNLADTAYDLRESFPNTPTILYFNGGPKDALVYRDASIGSGTGVGGPDTYIGAYEKDLHLRYSYDLAKEISDSVPVGYAVQWNNYTWIGASSAYVHPSGAVPVNDILSFSRDVLKSNFMFWAKREPYWTQVKDLFSKLGKKGDPFGGLRSSCPELLNCAR